MFVEIDTVSLLLVFVNVSWLSCTFAENAQVLKRAAMAKDVKLRR
ncbi:hypothetical protein VCRA213O314_10153 [Vibrio crassostreae]|nr:hypothetical protein VCRA213O314_10153 [Vibrio crassostreae]